MPYRFDRGARELSSRPNKKSEIGWQASARGTAEGKKKVASPEPFYKQRLFFETKKRG
jgi:hypothetical protein